MLSEPNVCLFLILCPKYDNWSPLVRFFFYLLFYLGHVSLLVLCLILLALSKASLNSSLSGHLR